MLFSSVIIQPLHTVGSVPEASNILPSRVTVAASAASNWNPEYALPLNGIAGLPYSDSVYMTNGAGPSTTHCQPVLQDTIRNTYCAAAPLEQQPNFQQRQTDNNNIKVTNSIGQNKIDFGFVAEHESDKRLTVIQRALDFIENICVNRHVEELWSVLLLQRKLSDVREYLLSESQESSSSTIPRGTATASSNTNKLIDEIDQRINALSLSIDSTTLNQNTNHDSMGFDLFNRIRHWFLQGGRSNAKDPPKSQGDDSKDRRKRRLANHIHKCKR